MNMLWTQIVFCFCFAIQNNLCTQHVLPIFSPYTELINSMDNVLSYCGLVNTRISTSEKDLPVFTYSKEPKTKCVWQQLLLIRNDVGNLEGVRARESLFIEIERTKQIPCCDIMTRAVLALYIPLNLNNA